MIEGQKVKALVYADAGTGKTTLAATAAAHPDMSPVLMLNLEGGLLSVAGMPNVDDIEIRSSADLEEAYWALIGKGRDEIVKAIYRKYKTVVIDSGTVLSNRVLVEWVQRNNERATARRKPRADGTLDDIQLEDYGKMSAQVLRMISWFYDLPMHVICTALAKTVYPPTDGKTDARILQPTEVRPDFTDKLGGRVMGVFDHVWYMYTDGNGGRYMLTQPSGIYKAKTRGRHFAAAIGNPVANPNLATMYATLLDAERAGFADTNESE